MYKCEPVIADGRKLIIYAPHIHSLSYIHGHVLQKIGYLVRDYFLHDPQRFADVPSAVMAISTYIKGTGTFEMIKIIIEDEKPIQE